MTDRPPVSPLADAPRGESERPAARPKRVIKRYSNRKLYDTQASSYVTLLHIADLIRGGEEVQVIDNATKEDKTDITLALVISEELKARPREIPLATVKALVRSRGGRLMTQLREGPIGRLIPEGGSTPPEAEATGSQSPDGALEGDEVRPETPEERASRAEARGILATIEQWQAAIDERVRAVLPHLKGFQELEKRLEALEKRVSELESRK